MNNYFYFTVVRSVRLEKLYILDHITIDKRFFYINVPLLFVQDFGTSLQMLADMLR
jgi:hypothetical protein